MKVDLLDSGCALQQGTGTLCLRPGMSRCSSQLNFELLCVHCRCQALLEVNCRSCSRMRASGWAWLTFCARVRAGGHWLRSIPSSRRHVPRDGDPFYVSVRSQQLCTLTD